MGLVYYIIVAWLILKTQNRFGRSEIHKTYQPREDHEIKYSSAEAIRLYEESHMSEDMDYQLLDHEQGGQSLKIFHKILNKAPLLVYEMMGDFFKERFVSNIAHTLKVIGFSHFVFFHPKQEVRILPAPMYLMRHTWLRAKLTKSTLLVVTRWMFVSLSLFTVMVSIIAGDFMFMLEFLPFVLLLTLFSYVIYLIIEVVLYIKQNRFSVKMAGELGLEMNDVDYVKEYLRKSLFRFIILQVITILFMAILIMWMLAAFNVN